MDYLNSVLALTDLGATCVIVMLKLRSNTDFIKATAVTPGFVGSEKGRLIGSVKRVKLAATVQID